VSSLRRHSASLPAAPALPAGPPRSSAMLLAALTLAAAAVTAALWMFATARTLRVAVATENEARLTGAAQLFAELRQLSQRALQAQGRLLGEDSRIKATLATDGVDAATVADILQDLLVVRRTGFLLVLTPDGRVFAEAGAAQLRGLDLSAAAVVQQARAAADAVIGSWIVAGKLLDLSVSPVRLGEATMGLLVVGEAVGAEQLAAVSKGTAVEVALVLGDKIGETPSQLDAALWTRLAVEPTPFAARQLERDGQRYLVGLAELPNAGGPLQARLALVRPLASADASFRLLTWLWWVPALLLVGLSLLRVPASLRRAVPS
jgi:Double sensory domain of two-component sensor kinase